MTTSALPLARTRPIFVPVVLTALAIGLVVGPFSTKAAGLTWLVWCLWGVCLRLLPQVGSRPEPHPGLPAVHAWAAGCAATMGLAMIKSGYWGDPFDEVYGYLRLLLSAAAAYWVLSRVVLPKVTPQRVADTLALQCAAALLCLGWTAFRFLGDFRNLLPANAIPWAQAAAFGLCLLVPLALSSSGEAPWRRFAWWLGVALGTAAVLLSLSRGAYGVFAWMLWLVVLRWRDVHDCWPARRLMGMAAAVALVVAAVWWAPGDPLRVRLAEHEIVQAEDHAVFDTSLGTRLYLWNLAWQGLRHSPLVGVGETQRMYLIKHAGEELPEAQRNSLAYVRTMGHVHNQYLHAALDGGVMGICAVLALMLGMAAAAWRLRRVSPLASRQMLGLLFVHAAGGMTNVNFAHTYYVVTLATATAIVFLGMRNPPPAATPAP